MVKNPVASVCAVVARGVLVLVACGVDVREVLENSVLSRGVLGICAGDERELASSISIVNSPGLLFVDDEMRELWRTAEVTAKSLR